MNGSWRNSSKVSVRNQNGEQAAQKQKETKKIQNKIKDDRKKLDVFLHKLYDQKENTVTFSTQFQIQPLN